MKPYDGGGWARRQPDRRRGRRCAKAYERERQAASCTCRRRSIRSTASCAASASGRRRTLVQLRPGGAAARPLHAWTTDFIADEEAQPARDITLTINAFFGWDFNSCEALRKDGDVAPDRLRQPCPDSQVTSLHYHFPWLVKANLRWSIFCAATKRPMRKNLDWEPFYDDRRRATCRTREQARARTPRSPTSGSRPTRFEEFCAKHLAPPRRGRVGVLRHRRSRKDAVRQKVAALFPAHEVEQFTELFWQPHPARGGPTNAAPRA